MKLHDQSIPYPRSLNIDNVIKNSSNMKKVFLYVSFGFVVTAIPFANAQHLGLVAGESIETIRAKTTGLEETSTSSYYKATKLPMNPPGNDNGYRLTIGRKTGLCQINVFWQFPNDSRYGDNVKSKYDSLEKALDGKYGSGRPLKFVRTGALWDESDEFMMSLYKNERYHSTYWDDADGNKLPSNTDIISIDIKGVSSNSSLIKLTYQFNNFSKCKAESSLIDNSML